MGQGKIKCDDPHVDGVESPLNVARGRTHFRCEELTRLEPCQLREYPSTEHGGVDKRPRKKGTFNGH